MLNRLFYTHKGAKYAIVAFVLFCIFFRPISFILKITGINALMRTIGLLDNKGMFSFEMALVYCILFVAFFSIFGFIHWTVFCYKSRKIAKENREKYGYYRFNC